MPEPPEIGFEPHWLSDIAPSMQMPNIAGRNKPVPHSGDNTLEHTKGISNMSVITQNEASQCPYSSHLD